MLLLKRSDTCWLLDAPSTPLDTTLAPSTQSVRGTSSKYPRHHPSTHPRHYLDTPSTPLDTLDGQGSSACQAAVLSRPRITDPDSEAPRGHSDAGRAKITRQDPRHPSLQSRNTSLSLKFQWGLPETHSQSGSQGSLGRSPLESNSLKSGEKSSGMFNYLQFQRLEIQVDPMIVHE